MKRFWEKVDKSGDCWEWTASRGTSGYGQFGVNRKPVGAHRVAYELQNGPIPDGMCVLHKCDNRLCVRGDHLFLGDHQSNMRDKVAKGRQPVGEGHHNSKFTEGDVRTFRELVDAGCKQSCISGFFDIPRQTLSDIIRGKVWGHV